LRGGIQAMAEKLMKGFTLRNRGGSIC